MKVLAEEKHLQFTVEVENSVPSKIIGDAMRLRQVLLNVIGNAIKFTEQGFVKVKLGVSQRAGKEGLLEFVVKDSGLGINSHAAAKLFAAFVQANASTTRKYGGTGLGLALSKNEVITTAS